MTIVFYFLTRPDSHIYWETIHWIVKIFASKQHWELHWFQKKQSRKQDKSHWIWFSLWKNSPLISAMFKPRPTLFFTLLIILKKKINTNEERDWELKFNRHVLECKAKVYEMNMHKCIDCTKLTYCHQSTWKDQPHLLHHWWFWMKKYVLDKVFCYCTYFVLMVVLARKFRRDF